MTVYEVAVGVDQRPYAAQLVDAPDERLGVGVCKPIILEVEDWHAVREVVPRVPVEELGFRHAAVWPHEVVESPRRAVGDTPLYPRVAVPVNERCALRGLHDVEQARVGEVQALVVVAYVYSFEHF